MLPLTATTRLNWTDASALCRLLAEHLAEHGADIHCDREREWRIDTQQGGATLRAEGQLLHIATAAADAEALMELQYLFASHIGEFTRERPLDIVWEGDGEEIASLPSLRTLRVEAVRDLSPCMRRITFSGARLRRFDTLAALHAKLLLPPPGAPLCLPRLTAAGTVDWGPQEARALIRKYTLRAVDAETGRVTVDFVLHGDEAPGSRFACHARAGDEIGMIGPGGGSAPPAGWTLLAGDETALPAIARLAEALPPQAKGLALIEAASDDEWQEISRPEGFEIRWLARGARRPGALLCEQITRLTLPEEDDLFAWAGCEFDAFRTVRADWRKRQRLAKERHLAVSYWREGFAQT